MMKCTHCDATVLTAATPALGSSSQFSPPLAVPPASPLRGRESIREIAHRHCTCTCRGDPEVLQNHTNLCDEISDAILEYATRSASPPEQPAARKWSGPGYLEQTGYIDPEQPQRDLGVASDSDRTTTVPDRTTDATPCRSGGGMTTPASPPEQPAAPSMTGKTQT